MQFGPSVVVEHERHALGLAKSSASTAPPPRTVREHSALGRAYLASGDLDRASEELTKALRLDPAGRWPNFYFGQCAHRLGCHLDAVAAFSVCIGIAK